MAPKAQHGPCDECGQFSTRRRRSLCQRCYSRWYSRQNAERTRLKRKITPPKPCAGCGEVRLIEAHELCHACYSRRWNAEHPDKNAEYRRRYYAAHKDAHQAASARWKKANPDKVSAAYKRRHAANPEHFRAWGRAWAAAHPEQRRAYMRKWRAKNLPKWSHYQRLRENRKRSVAATLTFEQWQAIQNAYDHKCAYCGKQSQHLTQDHVTPISKGGETTIGNIVPACRSCNSRKRSGPPPKPIQPLLL